MSPILGQNIQYMQDHALICKFMGLWPSEKVLLWWIKTRWKPKGDVSLKLGSKGFFTTIFNQVEDEKESSKKAHTSLIQLDSTYAYGKKIVSQKRKISQWLQSRLGYIRFRSIGTRKS
jgi:hypothetical protein